jgi:ligand-binding sensor domain-containing protein/signal transduction histidine kinase
MPNNRRKLQFAWQWLGILLSVIPALNGLATQSGSSFVVDVWGARQGLPQSSVISVIQSKNGYLWLGTLNGMARFDGNRFTIFDENNTADLNSDRIVYLFEDSRTNLWIGTDTAGLALVQDGKVKSFEIGHGGHESRLTSACEDSTGGVWLYTADAHLAHYQNGKLEVLNLPISVPAICRMIAAEKSGPLWIAECEIGATGGFGEMFSFQPRNFHPPTLALDQFVQAQRIDFILAGKNGGTWRLMDGSVQKWSSTKLEKNFGLYPWTTNVTSACEDNEGNLVVGTFGEGIFWFDAAAGKFQNVSTNQGLSSALVLSLCMDRSGNLWAGTDGGGLDRIKRKTFNSPDALHPFTAQSISQDANGGLWAAFNAYGVSRLSTNPPEDFGLANGLLDPNAWTVLVDHRQQVWVGTRFGGLFQFQTNHFVPAPGAEILGPQIFALFEDRNGSLWAGSHNGLANFGGQKWKLFTAHDGLSENTIRAIAEDALGNLWIGTENEGLDFFKDGKFISYKQSASGLPGNDISCLYVDKDNVLWIGTSGHGLARFQNGEWTRYSTDAGLASNHINYLLEDNDGNLWIGSNAGLMRIPKKSLNDFANGATKLISCRTYAEADGLPTRECSGGSQPAALLARDGQIFFPTTKGVVSVNPAELKPNSQPPQIFIESVRIDGMEQKTNLLDCAWPQTVVVPPGYEQLEIDYTALNFSAPDAARFKCWLENRESAPAEVGGERVARYPKLPPGDYRFHVTACNEDGIWNQTGSVLEITVQPWFWQTNSFRAAAIIFLLGVVAAIVRYISTQKLRREVQLFKQQKALEKERSRIARDLHDQLGANLTQVALLGEMAGADKNSPDEIESHAKQISETARETTHSLDEIVWAINPSNDTLEGLANYACKYAQEYLALAGLRYRTDLPTQLPPTPIPPEVRHNVFLAFKEAVNNVVKHAQASEAWIRLRLQPGEFILEIEDNGRGIQNQTAPQNRNGLRNMKKRMDDIRGEFSISDGSNGGTIVRMKIPLGKT